MQPNLPYVILLVVVAATTVGLAIYAWRYRAASNVIRPFMVLMFAVSQWAFTYGIELANTTHDAKLFWAKMHWFGVVVIPVAWWAFVCNYVGYDKWVTKRNVVLLSILPIISLVVVWTNDMHHFLWRTTALNTSSGPFPIMEVSYGFWFVISAAYFYLLILFSNALLIRSFIRSPNLYRGQIAILLIGTFIPLAADLVHSLGLNHPFPYMDIAPVAFGISGLMLAWAIFRYRLLDIVPVARDFLFESMAEGVLVLDMQNRVVDINIAALKLINMPASNVIGTPIVGLLGDWSNLAEQFINVLHTQTEISQTVNGSLRYYNLSISPLQNRQGLHTGRLIILREITKRKQNEAELENYRLHLEELVEERTNKLQESQQRYQALYERLESLDRLKDDFIDSVSHELRTPLTNLKLYHRLLDLNPDAEKRLTYTSVLSRETNKLEQIIEGILSVSQLMQELKNFAMAEIDLNNLIDQFVVNRSVLAQAHEKNLDFKLDIAPERPLIIGNQILLEKVVDALIKNAMDYTPAGGQIELCTTIERGKSQPLICLYIADSGLGLQPDELGHVFDRFYRGASALASGVSGSGLGLFTSKEIIERHGGGIDIFGKGLLGKGVTIRVWLPFANLEFTHLAQKDEKGQDTAVIQSPQT